MPIKSLKESNFIAGGSIHTQFRKLLDELKNKELPDKIIASINQDIEAINTTTLTGKEFIKFVKEKQAAILKMLEKELKIVPKNHYRNLWLVLGMAAFGLPIGVALGLSIGNMALLGIGLPIGMAIGISIGTAMDKKAFEEGRQLGMEMKH